MSYIKFRFRMTVLAAIFSPALALFLCSCSQKPPPSIAVPGTISTVAAGYPIALQIKNQINRDAQLITVMIEFDREGPKFLVPQISYGFASPKAGGRGFVVAVDNVRHEAYASMDAPKPEQDPLHATGKAGPLDLTAMAHDIWRVLEIARTNGLGEFCRLASPGNGKVGLRLFNGETGPIWCVIGGARDEQGPIADLTVTVDARTGGVLDHQLQRAATPQ